MHLTRTLSRWLVCGIGAAGLGAAPHAAQAQTSSPPAWVSAQGVSSGSVDGVVTDAAGNTYVTGIITTIEPVAIGGTVLTSAGNNDGYLAKFTPGGTLAWVRQFGTAGYDACRSAAVDAAGNVYVVGSYGGTLSFGSVVLNGSSAASSPRGFVMRFDGQGTAIWAQELSTSSLADVKVSAAGEVYVTGLFSQPLTVGSFTLTQPNAGGISSTFLLKYAATGTVLQASVAHTYVPNTTNRFYFPSLALGAGGEVYLFSPFVGNPQFGSTVLTNRGGVDAFVARYSAQGTLSWVQQLGGSGDDLLREVSADAAGNVYVSGYFAGPATIGTTTLPGTGAADGLVAKLDSQGSVQWTRVLGGSGADAVTGNLLDAAGNLYVTGGFSGTTSFGGATLTSTGGNDILLASLTPQGTLRWVQQAGGPGNDTGLFLTLDGSQQLRVLGFYENNCRFGSQTLTLAAGPPACYLASVGVVTSLRPEVGAQALRLYPNPARTVAQATGLPAGLPMQLHDALGRVVRTAVSGASGISVAGLPSGLYTLRATDGRGQHYAGRLVVQ